MIGDLAWLFGSFFAVSFGITFGCLSGFFALVAVMRLGARVFKTDTPPPEQEPTKDRPIPDWH